MAARVVMRTGSPLARRSRELTVGEKRRPRPDPGPRQAGNVAAVSGRDVVLLQIILGLAEGA